MATSSPMNRPFAEMPRFAPLPPQLPQLPTRPDTDGNVRPLTDFNPVNGQASSFDGMSRTAFFGKALQANPAKGQSIGGAGGIYGGIQRGAMGLPPVPDARSFGTGGVNFAGPPAATLPTLPGSAPKQPGFGAALPAPTLPTLPSLPSLPSLPGNAPARPSMGMLVAGPGGSVKWQPGTGPGTTAPPQRPNFDLPALPQLPMGGMGGGSRIAQSPMNRPYAELMGSTGSLANRGTRPIGRSANDPMRIAEQLRRRGDPSAILRLGAQQMGQDFARERDAVNFAQQQQMFGQQQQAMDARDARDYQRSQQDWQRNQSAMDARDAQNFQQQQQLEAERRAAEQAQQDAERNRAPNVQFQPIPGTGYGIPSADGRPMGTVPLQQQQEPVWAHNGEPVSPQRPAPKPEKPQAPAITWRKDLAGNEVPYQTIVDAQGRASLRRVTIIDENGDGIDDRSQTGDAPPSQAGDQPAGSAGKTKSGIKWSLGGM